MMYLDAPPRLINTEVFSAMPEEFRRKGTATSWAEANRPGQPTDCFIEGPSFDAAGNLYIVDIPFGRIFRIAPDGKWSLVIEYDGWPNGLKIAPDRRVLAADYMHGLMEFDVMAGRKRLVLDPSETVLFVAMTRDNAVWRMPFMKDGGVSKVGRFCSTFGASGPDGLTMDKAGRLFVAHASLGHVFVFAPNGELIARIKSCAGPSCTNVAIGGKNRDRLYVTESATGTVLVADIGVLDSSLRGA